MSAMSAHHGLASFRSDCAPPARSRELLALHAQLDELELLLDEHAGTTPTGLLGEVLRQVEIEVDALGAQHVPSPAQATPPAVIQPTRFRKKK